MTETGQPSSRRRWLWIGGGACLVVAVVAAILVFMNRPAKTRDPLNNVINERLIVALLGASREPEPPCFLVGFEEAPWPSEERNTIGKLGEDGRMTFNFSSNRGSQVTTQCGAGGMPHTRRGTLKLGDGRTIQLDRVYQFNGADGTATIQDTSTITDERGQELRNNLIETLDNVGRTASVTGVITGSVTGEHKINRTYTYINDDSGYRVLHTDHK